MFQLDCFIEIAKLKQRIEMAIKVENWKLKIMTNWDEKIF